MRALVTLVLSLGTEELRSIEDNEFWSVRKKRGTHKILPQVFALKETTELNLTFHFRPHKMFKTQL